MVTTGQEMVREQIFQGQEISPSVRERILIYCNLCEWNRSRILFNEIERQPDAGFPRNSILFLIMLSIHVTSLAESRNK